MYFWKTRALKQKLADGTVTEAQAFPYFLIYVTLMTCAATFTLGGGDAASDTTLVTRTLEYLAIPITILGILHLWRRNGGAGGRDFLIRYFTLGWVVIIRTIVLMLVVNIALLFLLTSAPPQTQELAFLIVNTGILIGYYLRLGTHFQDLHRTTSPAEAPDAPGT